MILFCIPYAGGSATFYYKWERYLGYDIRLVPIELKGKGARFNETTYEDFNQITEDILNIIKEDIKNEEYAFYGHSMGALLAFELYYKVKEHHLKLPSHIFFSSFSLPSESKKRAGLHKLTDNELLNELIPLGGFDKEILENQELIKICLSILRNDYRLLDSYIYLRRNEKIMSNVSILFGKEESYNQSNIEELRNMISGECSFYEYSGGHFFLNDHFIQIINLIKSKLCKKE